MRIDMSPLLTNYTPKKIDLMENSCLFMSKSASSLSTEHFSVPFPIMFNPPIRDAHAERYGQNGIEIKQLKQICNADNYLTDTFSARNASQAPFA